MITIDVDYKSVVRELNDIAEKQLPFAMSKAINATMAAPRGGVSGALTIQGAERLQLRRVFDVRQTSWADRSIKVVHFATKRENWGTIGIHPPGGDARADIFGKFESDREKRPRDGHTIAVPIHSRVRRLKGGAISKSVRPKAFNFRQVGNTIRGDKGTFLIRQPDGSGLILQRTKRGGVVALYRLVTRAELSPDLHFVDTAITAIDRVWDANMLKALDEALRTAK